MASAVDVVRQGLDTSLCRVLEVGAGDHELVYVAGDGWQAAWLREPVFDAVAETQDHFVLGARETLVVGDFHTETRLRPSPILAAHGVRSAVEALVCGAGGAYGVLGAYAEQPNRFHADSAHFVQSVSNTLAAAIERKQSEDRLAYMAQFDALTALPNRSMFLDRLGHTLIEADRDKLPVGVCSSTSTGSRTSTTPSATMSATGCWWRSREPAPQCACGPATRSAGSAATSSVSPSPTSPPTTPAMWHRKIVDVLSAPFQLDTHEVYVSASIGVGLYPIDGYEPDTLLKMPTPRCTGPRSGRNAYQFYMPQMNESALARMHIEAQLRGALDRGEYLLHYQPKVRLATGEICGMEALLRWQPAGRGLVPPGDFIPVLEDTGLIMPVGAWVLTTVCAQIRRWQAEGLVVQPVAVNLSARQFRQKNLSAEIGDILASAGVDPGLLELELTESSLMSDSEGAVEALLDMKAFGIRLSVDDFGTGYSSLAYLKRFPARHAEDRPRLHPRRHHRPRRRDHRVDHHQPGPQPEAEGGRRRRRDRRTQLDFLRAHGCDEMQGYYFSRPLPVDQITQALREGRRLSPPSLPTLTLAAA